MTGNLAVLGGSQVAVPATPSAQADSVAARDSNADIAHRNETLSGYLDTNGLQLAIVTKTANYTAQTTDYTILGDATSGAITITLPPAATSAGITFCIKKIDNTNNVVIDGNASETIDGATTVTLSTQWAFRVIHCNGTSWFVIGS